MFKNTYYDTKKSTMHIWEQINGENFYDTIEWIPYTFLRSKEGDIKTIDGFTVEKREFNTYFEYYEFMKDNPSVFENKVRPEIQFLAERYHTIPDEEIQSPKLKVYYIDIEVKHEGGFPKPSKAEYPICLISIKDSETGRTVSFGEKPYEGEKDVLYVHCPDEKELMRKFFAFLNKYPADVISGWNVYSFDLPYIINRSELLFGEDARLFNQMSPINVVRKWKSKSGEMNIDIAGVCILDYLDIYKWYTPHNLESYTLDFVSKFELEKGKVDYSEYRDLKELYEKDWDKYVYYNMIDCKRVYELEKKLGYIKLVQSLSLLTKVPMKYYSAMTALIEGALLTHFRRNGYCAPYFSGGTQETFEAAYVKEPQKGLWSWLFSLDIQSSYPSHIITLNMSTETYFGRILGMTEDQVTECSYHKNFPEFDLLKENGLTKISGKKLKNFNAALKRGFFATAPCGSIFTTKNTGTLAAVERNIFHKRIEIKSMMYEAIKRKSKVTDKKQLQIYSEEINRLHTFQWSLKILLNAMFGVTAVPYSRYFNPSIAEAITSCGRHTLKAGERYTNDVMNNPIVHSDLSKYLGVKADIIGNTVDYVIYGDSVASDSEVVIKNKGSVKFNKIKNLFEKVDSENNGKEYYFPNGLEIATLDEDGKSIFSNVKYVMRHKANKQMFRVYLTNKHYIDVTEDHSLIGYLNTYWRKNVNRLSDRFVEVKPTEIGNKIKSLITLKKIERPASNIRSKNFSKEIYNFMGLFVGDGSFNSSLDRKNYYLSISTGSADREEIIDKIIKPLQSQGWVKNYWRKREHDIMFNGISLCKLMEDFRDKNGNKIIPLWLFNESERNLSYFFQGIFESDGSKSIKNDSNTFVVRFCQNNFDLIRDLGKLLSFISIPYSVFGSNHENHYNGKFSGTFSNYLYIKDNHEFFRKINFISERKREITESIKHNRKNPTERDFCVSGSKIKIEKIDYDDFVYDISTDNGMFFANNILVHNTDSVYVHMDDFCRKHIDGWNEKTDDEKIDIIDDISEKIEDYVNHMIYEHIQKGTYNSMVDDFKIHFNKEKIAKTGLFAKKKKYGVRALWVEGTKGEKISVTGLEIVRSDSSEIVRDRLKDVLNMILREEPEKTLLSKIRQDKKDLRNALPEEIAANISVRGIHKYIKQGKPIKGTPWHVKGVAAYRMLLKEFNIENDYDEIFDGLKAKVVYVKPNRFGVETVTFQRWPKEFEGHIEVDYDKMIENFYIKKIEILLKPMKREDLLTDKSSEQAVNAFFGGA